ncbi:hypothetical protein DMENIID0001_156710 [Sergentomyia squamirostris]
MVLMCSKDKLCHVMATFETPTICSMLGLDPPAVDLNAGTTTPKTPEGGKDGDKDKTPDSKDDEKKSGSGISGVGVFFIVVAVLGLLGGAGFALKDPERREKLLSLIQRKDTNITYSRVSNEEASLLMNPATLAESDDELLI